MIMVFAYNGMICFSPNQLNLLQFKCEKPTPLGVGWIAKGLDMSLILSLIHSLE